MLGGFVADFNRRVITANQDGRSSDVLALTALTKRVKRWPCAVSRRADWVDFEVIGPNACIDAIADHLVEKGPKSAVTVNPKDSLFCHGEIRLSCDFPKGIIDDLLNERIKRK